MRPMSKGAEENQIVKWEDSIVQWAEGLTAESIRVIEDGERYLYPETVKRRNPKTGKVDEKPVMVRVPNADERLEARVESLEFIRKRMGRDKPFGLDDAKAALGVDQVSEVEAIHILSKAIRRVDAPHDPWMLPHFLMSMPPAYLVEVQGRIDFYAKLEDPRIKKLNEKQFWAVVDAVRRVGHLGPFVALSGDTLDSFMLSTVSLLAISPMDRSSYGSLGEQATGT